MSLGGKDIAVPVGTAPGASLVARPRPLLDSSASPWDRSKAMRATRLIPIVLLGLVLPVAAQSQYRYSHSLGTHGNGDGEFDSPFDVEIDGDLLYVADSHNNRVQVIDRQGNFLRSWGGTGDLDGEFRRNRGITVDPRPAAQWVYVTDAKNDRVQRFALDGTHLDSWGSIGDGPDEFFRPRGIAVSSTGRVIICDADNQRVKIYSAALQLRRTFGIAGSGDGSFHGPYDVAVGPDDRIYVADAFNARVQVFDPDGGFLFAFGEYGPDDGQLVITRALTVADDGRIFVADIGDAQHDVDRIQCFDPEGRFLQRLGESGSGPGQLDNVNGLALDADGRLYAADSFNHRISVWVPEGVATESSSMSSWKGRWRPNR